MKKASEWILQKIQSQGITDNIIYPAGEQVIFYSTAPWEPVFDTDNIENSDNIALLLIRNEEAWWIINQSDEYCCSVNDNLVDSHHRMRLNDGDLIEWGLSSWRILREDASTHASQAQNITSQQPQPLSETMSEYLDLDWFKQQRIEQQNPFDIIPVCGAFATEVRTDDNNTLTQLYYEYRQALLSPEPDIHQSSDPFPQERESDAQDLTSLNDQTEEISTLQDMIAGELSIDDILDALDISDQEADWLVTDSHQDILRLISPEHTYHNTSKSVLPDLTQREHRIIGIDSHYRITSAQTNGEPPHDKK